MAQYNSYVVVNHATYQEFRDATLGNGYNVDYSAGGGYGNQCWDLCALLWWQYGLTLYTGPIGIAEECWTVSKDRNAVPPFIAIYSVSEIKRGDCVVFAGTTQYTTGHIAFADEDYVSGMTRMNFLGQNQGQGTAAPSNIANLPLQNVLGAFRNTNWTSGPTPTPTCSKKRKFPWAVALHKWYGYTKY